MNSTFEKDTGMRLVLEVGVDLDRARSDYTDLLEEIGEGNLKPFLDEITRSCREVLAALVDSRTVEGNSYSVQIKEGRLMFTGSELSHVIPADADDLLNEPF